MKQSNVEETIHTLHPTPGKTNRRIAKEKYEMMKKVMLSLLKGKTMTHNELFFAIENKLGKTFSGNISWYAETVKLDLEARKSIGRTSDKPQKYFIK